MLQKKPRNVEDSLAKKRAKGNFWEGQSLLPDWDLLEQKELFPLSHELEKWALGSHF